MKYFSNDQIQESLRILRPYNAFFGITFFVLKSGRIPVGSKKRFRLDAETRDFLDTHYKIHPKSAYYFRVMRKGGQKKDWVDPKYPSSGLQTINTQTFRDALLHDTHDNTWGWSTSYLTQLASKLPHGVKVPLYHIAVWLYKDRYWENNIHQSDVVQTIIREYGITDSEIAAIFQTDVISDLTEKQAFQDIPVRWPEILAPYSTPIDVPAESSGILTYLEAEDVGPMSRLVFQPGRRLNIITGDNGLGKTFLLDLCWWALTHEWAERPATPFKTGASKSPLIKFAVAGREETRPISAAYSTVKHVWEIKDKIPAESGLVVYARVDGSFAVWDPANRQLRGSAGTATNWPGMKFSREELWNGSNQIEGLIRDWVSWQQRPDRSHVFATFKAMLDRMSPPDFGPLQPGPPEPVLDFREVPTLIHPYGIVPILFESAGIRRIITLAYLLVWAWEEHKIQAKLQGKPEERQMVVLIDEAEAHLHPKWQRVILSALMSVAQILHAEMSVQWIIATHSPLILASGEPIWDSEFDRLFHIDLAKSGNVSFTERPFEMRGTIDSWLSSGLFGLIEPGSTDRESAIKLAITLQQQERPTKHDVEVATRLLRVHLPTEDPFWMRWMFFAESFGVSL